MKHAKKQLYLRCRRRSVPFRPERVSTIPDVWTWTKESLVPAINFQSPDCGQSTGNTCIGRSSYVLSNRILLVQKRLATSVQHGLAAIHSIRRHMQGAEIRHVGVRASGKQSQAETVFALCAKRQVAWWHWRCAYRQSLTWYGGGRVSRGRRGRDRLTHLQVGVIRASVWKT